jgi:hypothetical protein
MKQILFGHDDYVAKWVVSRAGGEWVSGSGTAIGLWDGERLVAGTIYDQYNGASCCIHVAGEYQGWLTKPFLWTAFAYPFLQLKVRKLIGLVSSSNEKSRKFQERLGFRLEAALKDAHPDGDLLVYTMTKDQCRWLNIKVASYGKVVRTASA